MSFEIWKLVCTGNFFFKQFFYFLLFFFFFAFQSTNAQRIENNTSNPIYFMSIADIHFDPFIYCTQKPCAVIENLRRSPVASWQSILTKQTGPFSYYGQDTNYRLLSFILLRAKYIEKQLPIQFVLVLGDFLAHDFKRHYKKYSTDRHGREYQLFVKKTLEFLTSQLTQALPKTHFYMAVGNNDSYQGNYTADPNGNFFHDMAHLWSRSSKDKSNQSSIEKSFASGGYYAIDSPQQKNLRIIVLNSTLFSYKEKGNQINEAALKELFWLHQQLKSAQQNQQKVLLAMHIPDAMNVSLTAKIRLFTLFDFWQAQYRKIFQAQLKQFSKQIVGILTAHTHAETLEILTIDHNEILQASTPSVSPIFGNNPSISLFTYSPTTNQLARFHTYYFPLSVRR